LRNKKEEAKARNNIKKSKLDGTVYVCQHCKHAYRWSTSGNGGRFILPDMIAKLPGMKKCPRCSISLISKPRNFVELGKVENGVVKYYNQKKKLVPLNKAPKTVTDKHNLRVLNPKTKKVYF
jgi:hypothetical protein